MLLLDCPKTTNSTTTTSDRLKMYYYPIKPNDSRPNPNPIFIMSSQRSRVNVWIIFNAAIYPSRLFMPKWWSQTWDTKSDLIKRDFTARKRNWWRKTIKQSCNYGISSALLFYCLRLINNLFQLMTNATPKYVHRPRQKGVHLYSCLFLLVSQRLSDYRSITWFDSHLIPIRCSRFKGGGGETSISCFVLPNFSYQITIRGGLIINLHY